MSPRVALVDLGLGNLHSVRQGLLATGAEVETVQEPRSLANFDRVVVPGQGAFRDGAAAVEAGWRAPLLTYLDLHKPYLGICLGMQLLFEGSEEAPGTRGLGAIAGTVKRFARQGRSADGGRIKVPHMGWNQLEETAHPWLREGAWFYFVHSFHCEPLATQRVAATAEHGSSFCAAIAQGPLLACQFHPEKSHDAGAELLQRFVTEGTP